MYSVYIYYGIEFFQYEYAVHILCLACALRIFISVRE